MHKKKKKGYLCNNFSKKIIDIAPLVLLHVPDTCPAAVRAWAVCDVGLVSCMYVYIVDNLVGRLKKINVLKNIRKL